MMRRKAGTVLVLLAMTAALGLWGQARPQGREKRLCPGRGAPPSAISAKGARSSSLLPRGRDARVEKRGASALAALPPTPENISCSGAPTLAFGTPTAAALSATSAQLNWTGCFGTTYQWPGGEKVFVINTTGMGIRDLRVTLTDIPAGRDPDLFLLTACLAGSCFAYGDHTLVVPELPEGIYYLVVDDYGGAFSYSCTVTAYAALNTLLVDADGSNLGAGYPNVGGVYSAALNNLGYAFTSLEVAADNSNSPSAGTLLAYKSVVWVTGQYDGLHGTRGSVLTAAQITALQGLLDGGGELLLVSQGYLREASAGLDIKMGESTFAYQYLHVSGVTNDMTSYLFNLAGENGDAIGDDGDWATGTTKLTLSGTTPVASAPVGMDTLFGTPSFRGDNGRAGVLWYDGALSGGDSSKLVFASFPMENTTPAAGFDLFVGRALAFLGNYGYSPVSTGAGFVDGTNANGLPDPGETIGIEFVVQNDDDKTHTAQAYLVMHDPFLMPLKESADLGTIAASGCTPDPSCRQAWTTFNIDIAPSCPVGHRAEFTINYWLDGAWYDGPSFGLWIGQAEVFLVKDEQLFPNTSPALVAYENALSGAGVTVAEYDSAFYGSPWYNDTTYMSNSNMISYGSVVWATGADYAYTLLPEISSPPTPAGTSSDERELRLLLQAGGHLLLCSQDYFWDYFGGSSCNPSCTVTATRPFPRNELGVATMAQDAYAEVDTAVTAQAGEDVCNGMAFSVQNGLSVTNYCDEVSVKAVSPYPVPRTLFTYPDAKAGALLYEGLVSGGTSTARLATFFFPFENMVESGSNTRTLLMKRLLYWFDFGDSQSSGAAQKRPEELLLAGGRDDRGRLAILWSKPALTCDGSAIPGEYQGYFTYRVYRSTSPQDVMSHLLQDGVTRTSYYEVAPPVGSVYYYKVNAVDVFGRESLTPFCP